MSTDIAALVSDNLDIWATAAERKSGAGRGGGKKLSLYGIERLRTLILDLAVRGKLVPQDAGDEPASVLIKNMSRQRSNLLKAGKIGRARKITPASDEPPFEIPATWQWMQIAEIGHDWGQEEPDQEFTYIDVGSIDQTRGCIREPNVLTAKDAPSRARKIVRLGTVIYSTVRPYLLNIAIVDKMFVPAPIASTAFAVVHPFDGIEAGFIYRYLRSAAFVRYVEGCQTGIAYPAINDRQFFSAWFPVPPTAEQKRIVAKVGELMALCDALEAQSASAMEAHQTLVETLLAALVRSTDAKDLADSWTRLEANFDTLFITDASIEILRQTVFELAVKGTLVAQNETEKHSPKLSAKQRKAAKHPFEIPPTWLCLPLAALGEFRGGGTPSKGRSDYWDGPLPWVSPKDMKRDYLADAQLHVSESALTGSAVKLIPPQSILFVVRGMILAHSFPVAVTTEAVTINQDMKALILDEPAMGEYLLRALKGLKREVLAKVARSSHGTCRLDSAVYGSLPIPVPPLAEQQRIVAKVDEIMALCDALKGRIADADETQRHLADAIVERAAA